MARRRALAATLAVLLGVGGAVVTAAPALAAAPVGGPTTPGIWGYHTVTFESLGSTVAEVAVVSGGLAPRQPAPTSAEGPFDGSVTGPPGAEEPFRFESTVITTDLVVRATFADTRIVQFLAGPAGEDADRIIDADEVRDGEPLGEIAPDVAEVPDGQVFTGEWYREDDPTRTPYDFAAPVTENFRLVPILVSGFAVSFVTDGTAVSPSSSSSPTPPSRLRISRPSRRRRGRATPSPSGGRMRRARNPSISR